MRYQPTYRLESQNSFNTEVCENIMKSIIDENLKYTNDYGAPRTALLCQHLCQEITQRITFLKFDRFDD